MQSFLRTVLRWSVCLLATAFIVVMAVGATDASPPEAEAAVPARESGKETTARSEMPSYLPAAEVTLGIEVGDNSTVSFGDIVAPIWLFRSGILFLNPRATLEDHGAEEYNVGLGYRHLLPQCNVILGANIFYDYRETSHGSTFNQLGLGAELLSDWIDARINYYLPEDDPQRVATYETESVSISRFHGGWVGGDDPFARVNQIVQYSGEGMTSITTMRQRFEVYENAMEGFDCEIGVRLPIPWVQDRMDMRVFGGYYFFNGTDGAEDISGFKVRLELRALPSLYLDAAWYEDDALYGSDYFIGARATIPVDLARLINGHNPFRGTLAGFKPRTQMPPFSERLTEMIMRDFRVQASVGQPREVIADRQVKTVTRGSGQQQQVVIQDNVTFVDADNTSGAEDGTAEHPYNTIEEAIDQAVGQMIYVFNAGTPYLENVMLKDGQILWGSGCLIPALNGRSFGSGIFPTLDGQSKGPTVTMANNTTVAGLRISNTLVEGAPSMVVLLPALGNMDISRVGVFGNGANNLTVQCNEITGNDHGAVLVRNSGNFTTTIRNNRVEHNSAYGMIVGGQGANGSFRLRAEGNHFNDNHLRGLVILAENYDDVIVGLVDNQANRNGLGGIEMILNGRDYVLANIAGVTAEDNNGSGITSFLNSPDGFAIGLFGPPAGLFDLLDMAAGLAGESPLSEEDMDIFSGSGPVAVSRNRDDNLSSVVQGWELALAGYFDIQANDCPNGFGIRSVVTSEGGVAVAAFARSDYLMSLLEAGADVINSQLGLDPPIVMPAYAASSPLEANRNYKGISSRVHGEIFAFTGFLGVEANNSTFGHGIESFVWNFDHGSGSAASVFARVTASGNNSSGIDSFTGGDSMGIAGFVDIQANNNVSGSGVSATVTGDSGSYFVMGSSDPLRPLIEMVNASSLLGQPIRIPEIPLYGPVQANGNGQAGVAAFVQSPNGIALLGILDVQANNNHGAGLNLYSSSDHGSAVTLVASSDKLLDVLNDIGSDLADELGLPGFLEELLAMPVPPHATLGPVQANNNGEMGINSVLHGAYDGLTLFAGVEANDNLAGNGIQNYVNVTDGDAMVVVAYTETSRNALHGVGITAFGTDGVEAGALNVTANSNTVMGLSATLISAYGPVDSGWFGMTANHNGLGGVYVLANAEEHVGLIVSGSTANFNANGFGFDVHLTSLDSHVYTRFGEGAMASSGLPPSIEALFPDGPVEAKGNRLGGINVNSQADTYNESHFNRVTADLNSGNGIALAAISAHSWVEATFTTNRASNNMGDGVRLQVLQAQSDIYVAGERNVLCYNFDNGLGVYNLTAPGTIMVDFGGGTWFGGMNSIYFNLNKEVFNATVETIWAKENWWGTTAVDNSLFTGDVERTPWLASDPNQP